MARRPKVILNSPGVEELLHDEGVRDYLDELASQVAATAISTAPVRTGVYRDSIDYGTDTTDRAVGRVWADSEHAMAVEAATGNLARALDAVVGVDPDELIDYVTKAGKKRKATRRQVEHWTRNQ